MRWKKKPLPEEGKLIKRKFFAFLPVSTETETRWLEFVNVEGFWIHEDTSIDNRCLYIFRSKWIWHSSKFLNK